MIDNFFGKPPLEIQKDRKRDGYPSETLYQVILCPFNLPFLFLLHHCIISCPKFFFGKLRLPGLFTFNRRLFGIPSFVFLKRLVVIRGRNNIRRGHEYSHAPAYGHHKCCKQNKVYIYVLYHIFSPFP